MYIVVDPDDILAQTLSDGALVPGPSSQAPLPQSDPRDEIGEK